MDECGCVCGTMSIISERLHLSVASVRLKVTRGIRSPRVSGAPDSAIQTLLDKCKADCNACEAAADLTEAQRSRFNIHRPVGVDFRNDVVHVPQHGHTTGCSISCQKVEYLLQSTLSSQHHVSFSTGFIHAVYFKDCGEGYLT